MSTELPPKPRLKANETPQSASYQKRLREWQRQRDLAEATAAQRAQNKREAAERAERDVLAEVSKGVSEADEAAATKPAKKPGTKDATKRRKALDEAIEGASR